MVTLKHKIYAKCRPSPRASRVHLHARGRAERLPPVVLGPTGPHGADVRPGLRRLALPEAVFSIPAGPEVQLPEGWGQLGVRDLGTGAVGSVRVYWDGTPPKASFVTPRFNAEPGRKGSYQVVAQTADENIVSIVVKWKLAIVPGREVPLFEQHFLGYDFAQHAACVPTTVGANLQWLQDTGQADVVGPFDGDNKGLVTTVGAFMGTDSSGTTGSGARDGTAWFLFLEEGLVPDQDYTLEHLGSGDADGSAGFTPQQMLEELQAGGAVSLGFHNVATDSGFGHFLALTNVVLNADGSARIAVMDPNVEPNPGGQTVGQYRIFKLNTNGKIDWTAGNPGYYSPPRARSSWTSC